MTRRAAPFSVRLPADLEAWIRAEAETAECSASAIIIDAVKARKRETDRMTAILDRSESIDRKHRGTGSGPGPDHRAP